MLFSGLPYLVGYMTISYAHYAASSATTFKALLLTGRLVSGIGMGWASAVVSVSLPLVNPLMDSLHSKWLPCQHL